MKRADWTEVRTLVSADPGGFWGLLLELLTWRHA